MSNNEELLLVLNEFNCILLEGCLNKRIHNEYHNEQVHELTDNINRILDICETAVTRAINTENRFMDMKGDLQSNIRNPLSCIKESCFLINMLMEKMSPQSEQLQEYLQIIEKAAEDIEKALKK